MLDDLEKLVFGKVFFNTTGVQVRFIRVLFGARHARLHGRAAFVGAC
jgi:hypothetical protein